MPKQQLNHSPYIDMDIETLKKLSTTHPNLVLEWAKDFWFLEDEKQGETYAAEALIAFQSISHAINCSPKKMVEWLVNKWGKFNDQRDGWCYTFGNNPSIEFKNVRQWIDGLVLKLLTEKPVVFSDLVEHKILPSREFWGRSYHSYFVHRYLSALYKKNAGNRFTILVRIWNMKPNEYSLTPIDGIIRCVLTDVYRDNPSSVLRFVQQKVKTLKYQQEFLRIAHKVMGIDS